MKGLNLLKGAFDFHVHTSPDVMQRSIDDIDLARKMRDIGMGGFIIKSHHSTSYGRAKLVSKIVEGVQVFGGISLNNSIGGLNPQAVDVAGRMGAKMIWFPTVDAYNEKDKFLDKENKKLPYWATIQRELYEKGMLRAPIKAVDESGKLLPEVDEILDLIRDYGMIMATGHLSVAESIMVIKRAKQRGVDKIVVTHPEFPTTNFTISQQKDLLQYKVYFERCYTTPATGKVEWDYVFKEVVETRPERNILSTDLGQPNAILPTEGMERFVSFFKERGLSDDDIHKMVVENQQKLLFD
ncbi:hypothetical protein ApAK_02290 [Thermoplasmatales archaeon AK]|nr:hypothetical protein [Thermoplasmatales archaeon AK]